MGAQTYRQLLEARLQELRDVRRDLQEWQCRLELKSRYPGLYQAVCGSSNHERFMGAVDYHLAEGYTLAEAYELIAQNAPELAVDLAADRSESA